MQHTHDTEATDVLPAHLFLPDRGWLERLFAVVDAGDTAGFVNFLTPDAVFRFGNAPRVVGAPAIGAAVTGFFAAIGSSRHRLINILCQERSAVCEGEVTYTRHDGSAVSYPFANVFEFCGDKIAMYRIYIDNSTLFAP